MHIRSELAKSKIKHLSSFSWAAKALLATRGTPDPYPTLPDSAPFAGATGLPSTSCSTLAAGVVAPAYTEYKSISYWEPCMSAAWLCAMADIYLHNLQLPALQETGITAEHAARVLHEIGIILSSITENDACQVQHSCRLWCISLLGL